MTTDLNALTVAELRAYAEDEHGMSFPSKLNKVEMIARIRELEGSAEPSIAGESTASEGNEDRTPTAVILTVPEDEDEQNFIRVNVNGRRYQLMKGKEVKVPYVVYDVLKNAVEYIPVKAKDELGKDTIVMKPRQRFPVSVIQFIY